MNKLAIIGIGLLVVLMFSGCTGNPSYSSDTSSTVSNPNAPTTQSSTVKVEQKEVATIDLFLAKMDSWDSDPSADGVEVTLQPRDKNDKSLEVNGVVNARIYTSELNTSTYKYEKSELVKEWNNVPVEKANYGFLGAKVRLEFDENFESASSYYLEVDFVYNGKTFSAVQNSVIDLSQ